MIEAYIYQKFLLRFSNIIDFYRIETGITSNGIPDVYYVTNLLNRTGWIELKIAKRNNEGFIYLPFRPGQQLFLSKHQKAYCGAYILFYFEGDLILTKDTRNLYIKKETINKTCLWSANFMKITKEEEKTFLKILINNY
jgi:hypothetical protein